MSVATYDKGEGTSGIRGQLYETKLLSLIFYRAKHDDSIEEFQLASNIADIGAFDDICIKVKMKGIAKPLIVCIQAKHKDDREQTLDIDVMKYFRSYLKIRERFEMDNKDEIFQGKFHETESYFVIYTSGKDKFSNDEVVGEFASQLNELIGTGGTAKQPYKHDAHVESLCHIFMKEQAISLAKQVAAYMSGERNFETMLSDELMLTYHVILARYVVEVSEIVPGGHRIATFQQGFIDNYLGEKLNLFKNTLYKEALGRRKIEPSDVKNLMSAFLAEPTDVIKLSKVIGTVITYNNGQLELAKTYAQLKTDLKRQLNQVDVSRSTVNEATTLAAREMLSKGLKVPAAFGNTDLMLSGSDAKKARRIKHLTSKFIELLVECKSGNTVTVDNSFDSGFLQLNGGIAGAIGNMFVLDEKTKLMKITDNWESLGDLAQALYKNLTYEIHNLHELRFHFKVNKFPKLSFDCSEYEATQARDFLNKLIFYSKQADENEVEQIIKDKIEEYQAEHPNYFQAKTDAMFLKYHDKIQKWWMQPKQASYLTKDSDIFEDAINYIIKDPLLSSINIMCMSIIKLVIDYTFTEDAVSSWNLLEHANTVIITENSTLTVVKVLQHLKNKDHVVLDLEYIVNLPTNDRNVLRTELKNTDGCKVIIFVCDKMLNTRDEIKSLENISKVVITKKTVIITNSASVETLQKYFPITHSPVHDENSLNDMSAESQKSILETRVMFQGVEVKLDLIVDDTSKGYVKGDILNEIMYKNKIEVGKLNTSRWYDGIKWKNLYFDRMVQKTINEYVMVSPPLKTLYDIEDDVVLITAEPGMGKSTLLYHLSLETKKCHPEVWIVRVNLLEYSREFSKWKEERTDINSLETLKFMCQVILREKLGNESNVTITLKEQNGVVYLKDCTDDPWIEFELKLFLHFFNDGKMIFLFDGFDEISPNYMNEAIKCIEVISKHRQKHKTWVTSRSYSEIEMLLQGAFGDPYSITHMSLKQKYEYLNKIWESYLVLKEFRKRQLQNVHCFLKFMSKIQYFMLAKYEWPLHEVYMNAWFYLKSQINITNQPSGDQSFSVKYDFEHVSRAILKQLEKQCVDYEAVADHTPLDVTVKAFFLINNICNVNENPHMKPFVRWYHDNNTITFFQKYLETYLVIRFVDKNNMDLFNPDITIAYERELAECIAKHKKLAAYAIFNQDAKKLFYANELEEIKETIKCIEKGEEKTGLICGVANDIPIFIHMTFTEYFAAEYVCDFFKKNEKDNEYLIVLIKYMFNLMVSRPNYDNVRTIIDSKIKMDVTLKRIMENNKEMIDNLLKERITEIHDEYVLSSFKDFWMYVDRELVVIRRVTGQTRRAGRRKRRRRVKRK
ncbi:hypothetical protein PYW07_017519 [Mythimna separata]|uniref:NACHT domain-containing protein n=1 Tax=Mythimna separata TaxID=271217 RepID=A0AAD7Y5Q4_MYTSE|nr:hypothetical protein PYW07_017519 [Mythimna separata]